MLATLQFDFVLYLLRIPKNQKAINTFRTLATITNVQYNYNNVFIAQANIAAVNILSKSLKLHIVFVLPALCIAL